MATRLIALVALVVLGVGLLLYARANAQGALREKPIYGGVKSVVDRMRAWFQGNF